MLSVQKMHTARRNENRFSYACIYLDIAFTPIRQYRDRPGSAIFSHSIILGGAEDINRFSR